MTRRPSTSVTATASAAHSFTVAPPRAVADARELAEALALTDRPEVADVALLLDTVASDWLWALAADGAGSRRSSGLPDVATAPSAASAAPEMARALAGDRNIGVLLSSCAPAPAKGRGHLLATLTRAAEEIFRSASKGVMRAAASGPKGARSRLNGAHEPRELAPLSGGFGPDCRGRSGGHTRRQPVSATPGHCAPAC